MKKTRRLTLSAIAAGLLGLAVIPASASANTVVAPGLTFPERQVGSVSDPQSVNVTVVCNTFNGMLNLCQTFDSYTRNFSFVGTNPGDFSFANVNCPLQIALITIPAQGCQLQIRFAPTAPGARSALFIAGTAVGGGPNPIPVNGSAVAAPVTPNQPGTTPGKKKGCKKGKGKKKGCKKKKK